MDSSKGVSFLADNSKVLGSLMSNSVWASAFTFLHIIIALCQLLYFICKDCIDPCSTAMPTLFGKEFF